MKNKEGYYIDDNGVKTIIPENKLRLITNDIDNIVEIKCNDNLEYLYVINQNLLKLKLNNNLKYLSFYNNNLNELKLNDNLKYLDCDINTKLFNIPKTCIIDIYE